MTTEEISEIRKRIKEKNPLIHAITNPISINQCANAVLAVGARPVMAEHPKEVLSVTLSADALLVNLGNITDARIKSIGISSKAANKHNIPFVLDAVGVACSELRRNFAKDIILQNRPAIIKGNYSEIKALEENDYKCFGVDAQNDLKKEDISYIAERLSKKSGAVILASGKVDIITDGKKLIYVKNGTPQLAEITGTGCMLGILCSTFLAEASPVDAATAAAVVLGICGELSETKKGSGSFLVNLIDNISVLSNEVLKKHLKMEGMKVVKI